MTAPTLTYGTGYLEDCLSITGYVETESSLVSALTVDPADIFKIEGTCNDAGEEYVYYELDITDFDANDTVGYNKWMLRYCTNVGLNGLGAKVEVVFDDAATEVIYGTVPQFSVPWKIASGTITETAKDVSKIRFYADDYPNTIAAGTFQVWYDFLMFYKGTFTFPRVCTIDGGGGLGANFGNKTAKLPVPSRDTDIIQKMGRRNTTFTLTGDIVGGETWGTPYGVNLLTAMDDPWCWFTSDLAEMKVIVKEFRPNMDAGSKSQCLYELDLEEFSYSDKGHARWLQKGWLGI